MKQKVETGFSVTEVEIICKKQPSCRHVNEASKLECSPETSCTVRGGTNTPLMTQST